MKKIKKILQLIAFGFASLATIFTIKNSSVEGAGSSITMSGYSGSIDIYFTEQMFVKDDFSNVVDDPVPGQTYYITFVLNVTSGLDAFGFAYEVQTDASSNFTYGFAIQSEAKSFIMSELGVKAKIAGYYGDPESMDGEDDYLDNGWSGGSKLEANALSIAIDEYSTPVVGYNGGTLSLQASGGSLSAGRYVLGKCKLEYGATSPSFALINTTFITNGADGTTNYPGGNSSANFVPSAGTASTETKMSTATYQGNNGGTVKTLSFDNNETYSGTVDAASTTASINLAVTDGGTITSIKKASDSSSVPVTNPFTMDLGAAGTTTTYIVESTAQDGETHKNYNISIKRDGNKSCVLTNLTATGSNASAVSLDAFSASKTSYTLKYASTLSTLSLTPTWDTTTNCTVTVKIGSGSYTPHSSGSPINLDSMISSAGTVKIKVQSQYDSLNSGSTANTKEITVTLQKVTVDLNASNVTVYDASTNATIGTATWSTANNRWEFTVPYSYSAVYFKVTLNTASDHTVSAFTPSGSGQSGNITSSQYDATSGYTANFTIRNNTFTTESKAFDVLLTRGAANNTNTLSNQYLALNSTDSATASTNVGITPDSSGKFSHEFAFGTTGVYYNFTKDYSGETVQMSSTSSTTGFSTITSNTKFDVSTTPKTYYVKVIPEGGNAKIYEITVSAAIGSTNSTPTLPFQVTDGTYTYTLSSGTGTTSDPYMNTDLFPYASTTASFIITAGDSTQTLYYNSTNSTGFSNIPSTWNSASFGTGPGIAFASVYTQTTIYVKVQIRAQAYASDNSKCSTYYIAIVRAAASSAKELDSWTITNQTDGSPISFGTPTTTSTNAEYVSTTYAYKDLPTGVDISASFKGASANISVTAGGTYSGTSPVTGTNLAGTFTGSATYSTYSSTELVIKVVITSEGKQTFTYLFKIERVAASTDGTLKTKDLKGHLDNASDFLTSESSSDLFFYNIAKKYNSTNQTSFDLSLETNNAEAKIAVFTTDPTTPTFSGATNTFTNTYAMSSTATYGETKVYVYVQTEAKTTAKYTFIVKYPDDRNQTVAITNITSTKIPSTDYTFTDGDYTPSKIYVAYNVTAIDLTITLDDNKASGVMLNNATPCQAATSGVVTFTSISLNDAGVATTLVLVPVAENNTLVGSTYSYTGNSYTLVIERKNASSAQEILTYRETYGSVTDQVNNQHLTSNQIYVNVGRSGGSIYRVKFTISPYAGYQVSASSSVTSAVISVTGDTSGGYIEGGTVLEFRVSGLIATAYVSIQIKVMSEKVQYSGGTPEYYTIYVFKADEDNDVSGIKLFSDSGKTKEIVDTSGNTYSLSKPATNTTKATADTMTINYSAASDAYYVVTFDSSTSSNARVSVKSTAQPKTLVTGSSGNDIEIITLSEYCYLRQQIDPTFDIGQISYFIKIIRNAADTNDLIDTFNANLASATGTVIVNSSTITDSTDTTTCRYTKNNDSFNIEYLPSSVSNVWVKITAQSDLAIFTVNTTTGLTNETTRYVMLDCSGLGNSIKIFNIYIYPESDRTNGHPYTINISRTTISLAENNEYGLVKISYDEVTNKTVNQNDEFTLVYSTTGATIVASAAANTSRAVIKVYKADGTTLVNTYDDKTYNVTVSNLLPTAGEKYVVKFEVTSGSGVKNPEEFKFTIERIAADDNTDVIKIIVKNTTTNYEVVVNNPNPGTSAAPTVVTMPFGTTEVEVTLEALKSTTTVPAPKITSGLHVGRNTTESYAVKAESDRIEKYFLCVFVSGDVNTDSNINFVLGVDEAENDLNFIMADQRTYQVTLSPSTDVATARLTFDSAIWNQYGAYEIAFDTTTNSNSLITYTKNATEFSKQMTVKVYALDADGKENTDNEFVYILKFVQREAEKGNLLLTITIDGTPLANFESGTNTYFVRYERSVSRTEITNLTASTGAAIEADGSAYADKTEKRNIVLTAGAYKLFEVDVTSETGSPNTYKFYLIPADNDKEISNIKFLTSSTGTDLVDVESNAKIVNFSPSLMNYSGTVTYTQNRGYLYVKASNANQKLFINGTQKSLTNKEYGSLEEFSSENTNVYTIYLLSEYDYIRSTIDSTWATNNKTGDFVITIIMKDADGDATLEKLIVKNVTTGAVIAFDPNTHTTTSGEFISGTSDSEYTITNVGNDLAAVNIIATPVKNTTIVLSGDGVQDMSSDATNQYIYTFKVKTRAENGDSCTYVIKISRGQLSLDDDNTIVLIKLYDSSNNYYVDEKTNTRAQQVFDKDQELYTSIVVPYGAQSITFSTSKLDGSECKIYYKTGTQAGVNSPDGTKSVQIISSMLGKTITYTVYAISLNGSIGIEYVFEVTFAKGGSNSAITLFTWNGTNVSGFDYNDLSTTSANNFQSDVIYIEYGDWSQVTISAIQDDPKATLSGDVGIDFDLIVGRNTFTVYCTPEDGTQASTYKLIIYRMPQTPFIELLETANGELYNGDGSEKTEFKSDEYKYVVKIKYAYTGDVLTTTVTETDFEVNGTNSTKSINGSLSASFTTATIQPGGSVTVKLTVSSKTSGASRSYTVVVQRASKESADATVSSIDIKGLDNSKKVIDQIDEFEYKTGIADLGNYNVDNIVTSLDVSVIAAQASEGASFKVYGPETLQAGMNTYVVVCTSADNTTQSVYTFTVTRAPMEWNVDKEATNYECKEVENKVSYNVNMKDGDATKVDWTKYIVYDETNNAITVSVVSDVEADSKQVVIMVTDGSVEEYVTMNLTYNGAPVFNWWIIGILIADVIILTAILISVNRDKYGKVTKKRKEI